MSDAAFLARLARAFGCGALGPEFVNAPPGWGVRPRPRCELRAGHPGPHEAGADLTWHGEHVATCEVTGSPRSSRERCSLPAGHGGPHKTLGGGESWHGVEPATVDVAAAIEARRRRWKLADAALDAAAADVVAAAARKGAPR